VKLNRLTIHDPGHSSLGSSGGVVVGCGVVVDGTGRLGAGRGFGVTATLVLSQHTDPRLQFDVLGMMTDGRSQNAAIMLSRQKPGHFGICGVVGFGVVVVAG
jgi:hypothetical protein